MGTTWRRACAEYGGDAVGRAVHGRLGLSKVRVTRGARGRGVDGGAVQGAGSTARGPRLDSACGPDTAAAQLGARRRRAWAQSAPKEFRLAMFDCPKLKFLQHKWTK
jgi:hypothetical protein